jgi:hypothetical protein
MSMLLRGENDHEFELGLVHDQFPEQQDGFSDSAFVTVGFRVATPEQSWEETAPVMNLFELKNLLEWLQAIARGQSGEIAEVELLEPNLRFAIVKDSGEHVTIRISFHLEDRPEQYVIDAPTDEASHVDFRLARDQVSIAAAELERDLQAASGPPRAGDDAETLGIYGQPDPDLNLLADDADSEFPQLAHEHDDFREIEDREASEFESRD